MLKLSKKPKHKPKRRNSEKDDREERRQKEIADFIAKKGVTKVSSSKYIPGGVTGSFGGSTGYRYSNNLQGVSSRLKDLHAQCKLCGSWTDESGELRHYDWCPTYKKSRKNPIATRKSNKLNRDIIQLDMDKTSRYNIFLTYKGKEIEFTGKDAEELRDIIKYQKSVFTKSSKLQKMYPKTIENAGGLYSYLTEILVDLYPKTFR